MFGVMAANPHSSYAATPVSVGGKALVTNTDGDNIRVRSGASTSYSQVAEAHGGETVSVLDGPAKDSSDRAWYKISAPGGTGWIMNDFLAGKEAPAAEPAQQRTDPAGNKLTGFAKVGNSDGDPVRLRTEPTGNGTVIDKFAPGTSVAVKQGPTVDSAGTAWYQVSGNGQTGWMMAEYLIQSEAPAAPPAARVEEPVQTAPAAPAATPAPATETSSPAPVAQPAAAEDPARSGTARGAEPPAQAAPANQGASIVNFALKYVGSRYVSGGAGPKVFDCSGFVYYVMRNMGVSVSRDMGTMWNSGTHVSSSNLQPGDVLFWSNTYKRGLSHVGIYIGNGKFVHAENQSTGVRISDFNSSYYISRYSGAVRLR